MPAISQIRKGRNLGTIWECASYDETGNKLEIQILKMSVEVLGMKTENSAEASFQFVLSSCRVQFGMCLEATRFLGSICFCLEQLDLEVVKAMGWICGNVWLGTDECF